MLPPISRLSREQVIYHFLNGYTSKMAGTEEGITSAVAAFSSCYGEPFLVWHPLKYAEMLADRLERQGADAWLLNTGWLGGAKHGQRCPLKYSRAIIDAIHSGELRNAEYKLCPQVNLSYPTTCTGNTTPSRPSSSSAVWCGDAYSVLWLWCGVAWPGLGWHGVA